VVLGGDADPIVGGLDHRSGPVPSARVDFSRFAAVTTPPVDRSRQSRTGATSHYGGVEQAFTA
jgi:hypothetical protein